MNNVYDIYYELLSEKNKNLKNELIFEAGKSTLNENYKFKFSTLNGADELNPEGKKALNAIKNIVETSDNGKLSDLINLNINEYLEAIENSFSGSEEGSIEELDGSNDEDETKENEPNENEDDELDDEPNENEDDELDEDPSEANKSKDDDNDDELAEEPSKSNKSKDDDDELAE